MTCNYHVLIVLLMFFFLGCSEYLPYPLEKLNDTSFHLFVDSGECFDVFRNCDTDDITFKFKTFAPIEPLVRNLKVYEGWKEVSTLQGTRLIRIEKDYNVYLEIKRGDENVYEVLYWKRTTRWS